MALGLVAAGFVARGVLARDGVEEGAAGMGTKLELTPSRCNYAKTLRAG